MDQKMEDIKVKSGLSIGPNRGFIVTPRKLPIRPSERKHRKATRAKFVRGVIRSMCGLPPYQKRAVEILKNGGQVFEKKVLKFLKKGLGTHRRAKLKREQLKNFIILQKKQHAAEKHAAEKHADA